MSSFHASVMNIRLKTNHVRLRFLHVSKLTRAQLTSEWGPFWELLQSEIEFMLQLELIVNEFQALYDKISTKLQRQDLEVGNQLFGNVKVAHCLTQVTDP